MNFIFAVLGSQSCMIIHRVASELHKVITEDWKIPSSDASCSHFGGLNLFLAHSPHTRAQVAVPIALYGNLGGLAINA